MQKVMIIMTFSLTTLHIFSGLGSLYYQIQDILDSNPDEEKALKKFQSFYSNYPINIDAIFPEARDMTLLTIIASMHSIQNALAKWLIVEKKADVNRKDNLFNYGPLAYAVMRGNFDLIKLLLENGADINATYGTYDDTALHIAANQNYKKEIIAYLLDKGANIEAKNKKGETALDILASSSELSKEVDVNRAHVNRILDNLKILIDHGANISPNAIKNAAMPKIKKFLQLTIQKKNKELFNKKLK